MHKRCISILGATLMLALSAVQSIAQTVTYSAALSPLPPAEARQKLIEQKVLAIEPKVIAWRRDLHQNPELSN
ncbi:MAG: hypothetical protein RML35_02585 [Chloroherpetonaceae bacterium]|nr:hypothetical protein [Chloroherpetonaceae bacterium]